MRWPADGGYLPHMRHHGELCKVTSSTVHLPTADAQGEGGGRGPRLGHGARPERRIGGAWRRWWFSGPVQRVLPCVAPA